MCTVECEIDVGISTETDGINECPIIREPHLVRDSGIDPFSSDVELLHGEILLQAESRLVYLRRILEDKINEIYPRLCDETLKCRGKIIGVIHPVATRSEGFRHFHEVGIAEIESP